MSNSPHEKFTLEIHLRNSPQKFTSWEIHLVRNSPFKKTTLQVHFQETHLTKNSPQLVFLEQNIFEWSRMINSSSKTHKIKFPITNYIYLKTTLNLPHIKSNYYYAQSFYFISSLKYPSSIPNDWVEKVWCIVFSSLHQYTHERVPLSSVFDGKRMFNQNQVIQSRYIVHSREYKNKLEGVASDSVIDFSTRWAEVISYFE